MAFRALRMKRHFVFDKIIVGIDPAKKRHQAAVLDKNGIQIANTTFYLKLHPQKNHNLPLVVASE